MIKRSLRFIFPILFLGLSCVHKDSRNSGEINTYFNIKGLVEQQLVMLDSISPSLFKIATINGNTERRQLIPDSLGWVRELEMLVDLDLNEPSLLGIYQEKQEPNRPGHTISYTSINPKKTKIDQLNIQFDPVSVLPVRLDATIHDSNPLFKLFRSLNFQFVQSEKSTLLQSYSITGWQKMILLDTNRFSISCQVIGK